MTSHADFFTCMWHFSPNTGAQLFNYVAKNQTKIVKQTCFLPFTLTTQFWPIVQTPFSGFIQRTFRGLYSVFAVQLNFKNLNICVELRHWMLSWFHRSISSLVIMAWLTVCPACVEFSALLKFFCFFFTLLKKNVSKLRTRGPHV